MPSTSIQIRDAEESDCAALAACVDAVARERRFLASVEGFGEDSTRTYLGAIRAAHGVSLVAVQRQAVIAWCDIMPDPFEGLRHSGRLGMGVLAGYRGQGIGRRVLRRAVALAFAQNLSRIELEVFASNRRAIRLYEQESFVLEGRKRRARILDGMEDDLLLMARLRATTETTDGSEEN